LNIQQALLWAEQELVQASSESPKLDAKVLLQHCLQKNRTYLITWPDKELTETQQSSYKSAIKQRVSGFPIAYIVGEREFWSLPLKVTSATLIPRPDTEVLVETVLNVLSENNVDELNEFSIADLGTGTGAIALALKNEHKNWRVYAVDASADALAVAKENAQMLNLDIVCQQGDWLNGFSKCSLDTIVSNPPYIDESDPHLSQGDVRFEPMSALVAKDSGYKDIADIIEQSVNVLKPGGLLFFEHGYQQSEGVQQLFENAGFVEIRSVLDYGGNPRVTYAQLPHE